MQSEFKKNDIVVYETTGVCKIEDIRREKFSYETSERLYYILKPLKSSASTLYVPVDNKALTSKMRHVMTKEKINCLIDLGEKEDIPWNSDCRLRSQNYRRIMSNGISAEMFGMIRILYLRKELLKKQKKNLSVSDESFFNAAKKLVEEEISFSLGIDCDKVGEYIESRIS